MLRDYERAILEVVAARLPSRKEQAAFLEITPRRLHEKIVQYKLKVRADYRRHKSFKMPARVEILGVRHPHGYKAKAQHTPWVAFWVESHGGVDVNAGIAKAMKTLPEEIQAQCHDRSIRVHQPGRRIRLNKIKRTSRGWVVE